MPGLRRLDGLAVASKRVLVRVDLNVPLSEGKILDDTRLRRIVPTVRALLERGAAVILLSHLGRPGGKAVAELSLRRLCAALSALLGGCPVAFVEDVAGAPARAAAEALEYGSVLLLENLRFDPGEEANNPGFAARLAELGDAYVDDAFSCAHRAHASIDALARLLPAAAGLDMARELDMLENTLSAPTRPLTAIVGGAKVSTKLGVLEALAARVDALIVGGGMANTFLSARGLDVGRSLREGGQRESVGAVERALAARGARLLLPADAVVARDPRDDGAPRAVAVDSVPPDAMILDIGPACVAEIEARIEASRTIVWNGPLGAFERPPFDRGTLAVARAVAQATAAGKLASVAGGGETLAAIKRAGVAGRFTHLSTAGGAFLEWLEGRELPGVAALLA